MNKTEIKNLLSTDKNILLEFIGEFSRPQLAKKIVGFANTDGGTIIIGVDVRKQIIGLDNIKNITNLILKMIKEDFEPPLTLKIESHRLEHKQILILQIPSSKQKPHQINGHYYIRSEMLTRLATRPELKKMFESVEDFDFDRTIVKNSSIEDLDPHKILIYAERFRVLKETPLLGNDEKLMLKLNCLDSETHQPTVAGILLFAKYPQKFNEFNASTISIVRYPDSEIDSEYLTKKIIKGTLMEMIDEAYEYIMEYNRIAHIIKDDGIEEEISEYSPFAIRELLTNAIVHRDYRISGSQILIYIFKGRIEFHSPGTLPAFLKIEELENSQLLRNKIIANVLHSVEYIENIGTGIDRIISEAKKNMLLKNLPTFKQTSNTFIATLYSIPEEAMPEETVETEKESQFHNIIMDKLSIRQRKGLAYLLRNHRITTSEYAIINKIARSTARKDLKNMLLQGIIIQHGRTSNLYYGLAIEEEVDSSQ